MAYLSELHYCGICNVYLGPDDGDAICDYCESLICVICEKFDKETNKFGLCPKCADDEHETLSRHLNDIIGLG